MESVFYQSALLQPPVILGRQLKPFSCFHLLVLSAADSPLIEGGAVGKADLIFLLWVCGMEWETGRAALYAEGAAEEAMAWGKSVGPKWDFEDTLASVTKYLDEYMETPKTWSKGRDGKPSAIPVAFKLAADLLAHYSGFTEAQVWNMPVCMAACYRASVAEENGAEVQSMMQAAIIKRKNAKAPEEHEYWEGVVKRLAGERG